MGRRPPFPAPVSKNVVAANLQFPIRVRIELADAGLNASEPDVIAPPRPATSPSVKSLAPTSANSRETMCRLMPALPQ
jgi:hypothetical protein